MLPPIETVQVVHDENIGEARRRARDMAVAAGFISQYCEEIAIVATELATNLLKHAGGGKLTFTPLTMAGRTGLEIQAEDRGPGIPDVEQAIGDRFSTAGTSGTGLGAINRLMDELEIASQRGNGTRVLCRKWVRDHKRSIKPCPLSVGVSTRPRPPDQINGDAFVVMQWSESVLVGVIDGLGHGQLAHRASQTARQYVENHYDLPLDKIFLGMGRACRATRGVVMALARFDWDQHRLLFGSIGNIEVRVFPKSARFDFVVRRGVIGLNAPHAVITEHSWPFENMLVMHSDGVSTHWDWTDFPNWTNRGAADMANDLLRAKAKAEDDATVVVVRGGAS